MPLSLDHDVDHQELPVSSRKRGCLIAAAAGDALGKANEGISVEELSRYFHGRLTQFSQAPETTASFHLKPNQYTDDTKQARLLAESLVESGGRLNLDSFARYLVQWLNEEDNPATARGFGMTSLVSGHRLRMGVSPYESGVQDARSNGSLMRVAPIGVAYEDPKEARRAGMLSSLPTHASSVCMNAAGAMAQMVSLLIHNGKTPHEAVIAAWQDTEDPEVFEALEHAYDLQNVSPEKAMQRLGTSGLAKHTLGFAVYSFLHSPNDLYQTILTAANAVPGDTDTMATVAGALSGAWNGMGAVPESLRHVEDYDRIIALADAL